jgi:hypothetical protein
VVAEYSGQPGRRPALPAKKEWNMTTNNGTIPYHRARGSAESARREITATLKKFDCESVGFMDNFEDGSVTLAFRHRGRTVQLHASANGWAGLWLKQNPWSQRMKCTREEYERRAVKQGLIAVNSILRDWIKGQITAVECGMMSFEAVFLPHMIARDGRPLLEHMRGQNLLPAPSAA